MPEDFDAWQYLGYLRRRWTFLAVACAVALTLALTASLALPKKYTATARILIEPPAGTDPRSAMAISPIYLESLRTYEHFASSDSLFARALAQFHLREAGGMSIESLKRSVLRVSIPRDTRILEIRVTLSTASEAQALAQYLAEETVNMNRSVGREGDRELVESMEKQNAEARATLDRAESEWNRFLTHAPVPELQAEVDAERSLKTLLQHQLLSSEMDLATERWAGDAKARIGVLRKQLQDTEAALSRNQKLLADRRARASQLEAERKEAQTIAATVANRLQEVRAMYGYRGERLKVIDPGIVPERPSSPDLPLNVGIALFASTLCGLIYLTFEFAYRRHRAVGFRSEYVRSGDG